MPSRKVYNGGNVPPCGSDGIGHQPYGGKKGNEGVIVLRDMIATQNVASEALMQSAQCRRPLQLGLAAGSVTQGETDALVGPIT